MTSNFFSILYYNSEIWHLPSLNPKLKKTLLLASANALKLCLQHYDPMISFKNVHIQTNRAHPDKYCIYKHALMLHKIYNNQTPKLDWISLNFNQNFNQRNQYFMSHSNSKFKIGRNKLSERMIQLNKKIKLDDLNLEYTPFKIKCKLKFLSN